MAVRIDSAGDRLVRTSDVPTYTTNYTLIVWYYISSRPVSTNYDTIWAISRNSTTDYDWFGLRGASGSDTRLVVAKNPGGHETIGSTNLPATTWFPLILIRSAANSHIGYYDGVQEVNDTGTPSSRTTDPTRMEMGGFLTTNTDGANGRIAAVKLYTAALTLAEAINESRFYVPLRTADLHLWTPLLAHGDLADYSGNARDWTAGGTLTTEDGPPIPWAPARSRIFLPLAATGDQSLTISDSGTGNESAGVTSDLTAGEGGAGNDRATVASAPTLADGAAGAETASAAGLAILGEPGAGAELAGIAAALTAGDAGSGNDRAAVTSPPSLADSAAGSDSASAAASASVGDTGVAQEQAGVAGSLTASDGAAGSESPAIAGAATIGDGATGAESIVVAISGDDQIAVEYGDNATGNEQASITGTLTAGDGATGAETAAIGVATGYSDSATGDQAAAVAGSIGAGDSGAGAEGMTGLGALSAFDSAAGFESISVVVTEPGAVAPGAMCVALTIGATERAALTIDRDMAVALTIDATERATLALEGC